jgi:hypothetical protein
LACVYTGRVESAVEPAGRRAKERMGRCGKSTAKKRRILRMSQKDAAENAEREAMMGTRKGRKRLKARGLDHDLDAEWRGGGEDEGEDEDEVGQSGDEELAGMIEAAGRDPLCGLDDDALEEELENLRQGILVASGCSASSINAIRKESHKKAKREGKNQRRQAAKLQLAVLAKQMAALVLSHLSNMTSAQPKEVGTCTSVDKLTEEGCRVGGGGVEVEVGGKEVGASDDDDDDDDDDEEEEEEEEEEERLGLGERRASKAEEEEIEGEEEEEKEEEEEEDDDEEGQEVAEEAQPLIGTDPIVVEVASDRQSAKVRRLAMAFGLGVIDKVVAPKGGQGGTLHIVPRGGCIIPPPGQIDRLLAALGDPDTRES